MSATISLNCWIVSKDPGRIFPVELQVTKTVGALKDDAIREKKRPELDHVPADTLILWKVSIPANEDLEEKLEKLDLNSKHPLWPLMKLSSLFADHLVDDHLNIMVKVPPTGEFERISAFVTLHDFISCPSELGL
jgi:hypothetical protein